MFILIIWIGNETFRSGLRKSREERYGEEKYKEPKGLHILPLDHEKLFLEIRRCFCVEDPNYVKKLHALEWVPIHCNKRCISLSELSFFQASVLGFRGAESRRLHLSKYTLESDLISRRNCVCELLLYLSNQ